MAKFEKKKMNMLVVGRLPMPGESAESPMCSTCCNLRRVRRSDFLQPVGRPKCVAALPALPFIVCGQTALYEMNSVVYACNLGNSEGAAYRVGTLPGTLRCAASISPSRVVVMTSRGPVTIEITAPGVAAYVPGGSGYPVLHFVKSAEHSLSETVASRSLSGSYDARSPRLNAPDTENLGKDVIDAYERLSRAATAGGYFIQPVAARYRLLDKAGATLFVSAPCIVAAQSGTQCLRSYSAVIADGKRSASSIDAQIFSLRLELADNQSVANVGEVDSLVVELSAPLHPVDLEGEAANRVGALPQRTTGTAMIDYCLPGCSVGMNPSGAVAEARARGVAANPEEAFKAVAVVKNPFAGGSFSMEVKPAGVTSVAAQIKELQSATAATPKAVTGVAAECGLPHRFSAGCCAVAGRHIIWGDIATLPFQGYPAEMFATGCDAESGQWEAAVVVTMADGTRAVRFSAGDTGAPMRFSPLLTYPSADAREMKIMLRIEGSCYASTFPLTPTLDGTAAIHLADAAITLTPTADFTFPSATIAGKTYRSAAITCDIDAPLHPVDVAPPSPAAIRAIVSADRRGGAWEYAKNRVYLFTEGGTVIANLNSSGAWTSAHLFDRRPVADPRKVCVTTHDTYPVVALLGNDLVGFRNSTMATILPGVGGAQIAWDPVDGELWLKNSIGEVEVYPDLGTAHYTLSDVIAFDIASYDTTLMVLDDEGDVRSTAAGRKIEDIPIDYAIETQAIMRDDIPMLPRRLTAFTLGIRASRGVGEMKISGNEAPIASLTISAPVSGTIVSRVLAFPAMSVGLRVTGCFAADTTLRYATLRY